MATELLPGCHMVASSCASARAGFCTAPPARPLCTSVAAVTTSTSTATAPLSPRLRLGSVCRGAGDGATWVRKPGSAGCVPAPAWQARTACLPARPSNRSAMPQAYLADLPAICRHNKVAGQALRGKRSRMSRGAAVGMAAGAAARLAGAETAGVIALPPAAHRPPACSAPGRAPGKGCQSPPPPPGRTVEVWRGGGRREQVRGGRAAWGE